VATSKRKLAAGQYRPSMPRCRTENLYHFARTLFIEAVRDTAMEVTNEPQYVSATRTWDPSERRDVRRTIDHWLRNTWGTDSIPLLETFDFSPMKGDWGHRFLICGDDAVEHAVFVTYGPGFAQLLGCLKRR